MAIFIHQNNSQFPVPEEEKLINYLDWLVKHEHFKAGDINLVFTDNAEIIRLNRKYLNHDYYTDVITFYYQDPDLLSGDIFISLDKVSENALDYQTDFDNELLRVIFHGFLHLVGFNDQTEEEIRQMRRKEDYYLDHYNLEQK